MKNKLRLVHDLATPLTMIKLNCEQLKHKLPNRGLNSFLLRIDQGLTEMTELINSQTRISAPTIYHTTINTEIKKLLKFYQLKLHQSKISINTDLQEDYLLQNNYLAFKRIFSNLLCNAQDALLDQVSPKRIAIRTRRISEGFVLSIADNGKGIAPENLNKIYDYGFSSKKIINRVGHSDHVHGIGLYTVRDLLLTQFNAFITCNSELGVGTCFEVLFLEK